MTELTATPNGCRHCGDAEFHRGRQYTTSVGLHRYEPPPNALILARMLARRAARTGTKEA